MNKPHGAGRWRRLSLSLGACIALVLTLSGCSSNGKELSTLNPKGRYSRSIDHLFTPVGYIAIVVFVFVLGAVLFMWFRFRVKEHVEGDWPVQNHGNTKLEITWTIVPLFILAIIAVPSLATLQKLNSKANQNDMTVVVVGQQWWWEFRYYLGDNAASYNPKVDKLDGKQPDVITATQLVIPTGKDVRLVVTSRDVIHSFWIPRSTAKRDAVPGRFQPWKIEADNPGVYFGQCTEFCGLSHARMRMQTVAVSPSDFTQWVADQKAPYVPASATDQAWLAQQKEIAAGNKPAAGTALPDPTITLADGRQEPPRASSRSATSARAATCCAASTKTSTRGPIRSRGRHPSSPTLPVAPRLPAAFSISTTPTAPGTAPRSKRGYEIRRRRKMPTLRGKRGMPNLGLSADQIEGLVQFLMSTGQVPNKDVTIPRRR